MIGIGVTFQGYHLFPFIRFQNKTTDVNIHALFLSFIYDVSYKPLVIIYIISANSPSRENTAKHAQNNLFFVFKDISNATSAATSTMLSICSILSTNITNINNGVPVDKLCFRRLASYERISTTDSQRCK